MSYTVSFTTSEEALDWLSGMGFRLVRKLPAAYVAVNRGDDGEVIDMAAFKTGENEYEITEKVR